MEGDAAIDAVNSYLKISTHALTWRATNDLGQTITTYGDFYPRPHMEGDITVYVPLWMSTDFYPRPHMEGDALGSAINDVMEISTHALTWRATVPQQNSFYLNSHFYPRPHMEGDLCQVHGSTTPRRFLPTPPHGGRLVEDIALLIPLGFLPTPSHGGRQLSKEVKKTLGDISTHALTWRATRDCVGAQRLHRNFYPRPHMEGDISLRTYRILLPDFYPRPHMEGDCLSLLIFSSL